MLEAVETRFAEQQARFASFHGQLAGRFVGSRGARVARYLAAAQGVATKPLRLSIAGELNAGKTELANLILGVQLLPTSVIRNTLCPTVIRYGEAQAVRSYPDKTRFEETDASELHPLVQKGGWRVECALPLPLLRSVEITDLPPFDSVEFTSGCAAQLLRGSDLLIWCSHATRAWTATEKSAWLRLPARLKGRCLFVLTHADKLSAETLETVVQRLGAETLLAQANVAAIGLATPLAIAARSPRGQIMNSKLWKSSGGEFFFKRLSDFLLTALGYRQSSIERNTERLLSSVLKDPAEQRGDGIMVEWSALQPFFAADQAAPPEETAAAAIAAMARFRRDVLEPWLRQQNCPEEDIQAALALLPKSMTELGVTSSRHRFSERLPLIFQQLTAEIQVCRLDWGHQEKHSVSSLQNLFRNYK